MRWLRSPAVLMMTYVGLYVYAGPFVTIGSKSAHRSAVEIIIAVVLAALTVRGSRAARVLMITYSLIGVLAELFVSTSTWFSAGAVASRLGYSICYGAQVLLLVSTPIYKRTRSGYSREQRPSAPFLPAPRIWMVLASVAGGLIITVLPLVGWYGMRDSPCWPGHPAAHWGPCMALGYGHPFAYRFRGGIIQFRGGNPHWLFVAAPQGIHAAAFAADWAMWSIGALLALYLVSLNGRRNVGIAGGWSAPAPPAPAVP